MKKGLNSMARLMTSMVESKHSRDNIRANRPNWLIVIIKKGLKLPT